ncbi:hypothetical protein H2198_009109 [Neophaeococcomyces mojaviensis]|uniref:Uncharacterized protein n=1 Tax=Neophaeococcomyces mojaviensis TaxID=3383035 RepID=A0ACC2ZVK8_9EURO|nr:hypothetical protein H2198_009109 [Knufia sp. JES_112]
MSRKPANDTFTRFTSTSPSFSQSQPTSSQPPSQQLPSSGSQTNPNETPRERVARLRAEHAAKRAAAVSSADKVVAWGRRGADVAHRATTYSLLGFSAVASIVAAYGLISLVSHNRTQKRAWIEREMGKLDEARAAFLEGRANAEQLHLLEQERAGEELQSKWQEEKKQKRWFGNVRDRFNVAFGSGEKGAEGPSSGATGGERLLEERAPQPTQSQPQPQQAPRRFKMGDAEVELRPAAVQDSAVAGVGLDEKGRPVPIGKMQQVRVQPNPSVAKQAGDSAILETVQTSRRGGPLDQWAQNATSSVSGTGSSIWSSVFGGGRSSPSTSS